MNFRENHLHENELKLSDYNIEKSFRPKYMYFWYYFQFFILTLKSSSAKIINVYIFLTEICTFLNTVVGQLYFMFMQLFFFSKVHPVCHDIANGIKPGSDSKKNDKHAADCSKSVLWGVK